MVVDRAETARPVPPSPLSSDNCVKNHFYSKLRKSVRRLNKFISEHLQKEYEQISPRLLSKIIEYSESRFKSSVRVEEETIDYSIRTPLARLDLKNRLYKFENECDEAMDNQEDIEIAHHLIEDIFFFEKNNKKPGKLIRKRTNSFDNQQFLHPRACVRANRSNSNLSDLSDQSEDHSGCSSSYGDSYEEEEVTKPRKRSLTTTRSSKDVSSRNNSQIMEVKLETRSNNAKSETK
jgi:ribosomal protein L31E